MKKDILDLFKAARRVSTPFVAIETPDQRDLAIRLFGAVGNGENPAPKFTFDLARGLVAINEPAKGIVASLEDDFIGNPAGVLVAAQKFPAMSIIVMFNAQRYTDDGMVMQAICNLRDDFKTDRRTLVLLGPSFKFGAEYSDIVVFDEALPNDEQLGSILESIYGAALGCGPTTRRDTAIDAARGLPPFTAEQVFAMAMTPDGIDLESAWEYKKNIVNKTAGLKFVRNGQTFDELGGLDSAKEFMSKLMDGPKRPGCIVFLDEVEKSLAGALGVGDSSGVSQDFLGTWLSWMEDNFYDGLIAVGGPGTGKTALGMAVGATFDIPTVVVDVGGFKGSLVGESERKLREALKVIDSIAGEAGAFVFATCNKEGALPPEFKRRFRSGRWFFDLPTPEEKYKIWGIHQSKTFGECSDGRPEDKDWTGAEIRNACDLAWRLDISICDAAKYIVPIMKSDPNTIDALRKAAHGRWLSASYPGPYVGAVDQEQKKQERSVEFA